MSTPEVVDHVHDLILADRRISARTIAGTLEISRDSIWFMIHEQLGQVGAEMFECRRETKSSGHLQVDFEAF